MTRSQRSARDAGTRFESLVAGYLAEHVDDRIERRTKTGAKDRGDISGLRCWGKRVVVECKNTNRTELGVWVTEADIERRNDDADVALVVHKRKGRGDPGEQYVTCTLADLVALISGERPEEA